MIITIAGTPRQASIRMASLSLVLSRNGHDIGSVAYFRTRAGFTPAVGQDVQISGSGVSFGGIITRVDQGKDDAAKNVAYNVTVGDYGQTLLNRRLVFKRYDTQSATAIAQDLISSFTSGFTSTHVEASLPNVAVTFIGNSGVRAPLTYVGITVADALTQLAALVDPDCTWFIDASKDLWFFKTDTRTQPATVTAKTLLSDPSSEWRVSTDLSAVRTRVYVTGAGSSVVGGPLLVAVPPGATTIPLQSAVAFTAGGGSAQSGAQRITYTSASLTNAEIAAPVGTWTLSQHSGTGSHGINVTYTYKLTWLTAAGETLASTVSSSISTGDDGSGHGHDIDVHFTPTAGSVPTCVAGVLLYRSTSASAGAGPWKRTFGGISAVFATIASLGFISFADALFSDGSIAEPTLSTAGSDTPSASTTSGSTSVGATSVNVAECGVFTFGGGIALVTVAGVTYPIKFTAASAHYGSGALTGVPASGFGSVSVAIPTSTPIQNVPCLSGVPASGAGSVVDPIAPGDAIVCAVMRENSAAQTALAALQGGDGIVEATLNDSTLINLAELQAAGDAYLALYKDPEVTADFVSRDVNFAPGVTATLSIASPTSVSITPIVQQVTISQFDESPSTLSTPRRKITASKTHTTLTDVLRLIGGKRAA